MSIYGFVIITRMCIHDFVIITHVPWFCNYHTCVFMVFVIIAHVLLTFCNFYTCAFIIFFYCYIVQTIKKYHKLPEDRMCSLIFFFFFSCMKYDLSLSDVFNMRRKRNSTTTFSILLFNENIRWFKFPKRHVYILVLHLPAFYILVWIELPVVYKSKSYCL